MVVLLQALPHRHKVQTLKSAHLDDIVLEAPVLCLERHNEIDVFQQPSDCVCACAVRVGDAPEDVCGGQAVALDREAQTHRCGRVAGVRSGSRTFGEGAEL